MRGGAYLGGVEHHTGDLLGMALEGGQDLLGTLVEDDDVLIRPAWKDARETREPRPTHRTDSTAAPAPAPPPAPGLGQHSPVRTLLVSAGQRSRARIPGMLALCRPCHRISSGPARRPEPLTPPLPTLSCNPPTCPANSGWCSALCTGLCLDSHLPHHITGSQRGRKR